MKVINYSVLIYIEFAEGEYDLDGSLVAFLRSRGYTSLSSSFVHTCAVFAGHEDQVMSKSESVNDGAGYLRKRLQKLFKKVMQDHHFSCQISLFISPTDVTTTYIPRKRGGLRC